MRFWIQTPVKMRLRLLICSLVLIGAMNGSYGADFGKRSTTADYWQSDVRIKNTTTSPISVAGTPQITGPHATDFSVRVLTPGEVAPADDLIVRVTFNPSASGARTAQLSLSTAPSPLGTVTLPLSGSGGDFPETVLSGPGPHSLSGQVAGSVRLIQGVLDLTNDATIEGDLILMGGSLSQNSHSLSIGRNLDVAGPVTVVAGGTSPVSVGGHLLVRAGGLTVAGPGVRIDGDFRIQSPSEAVQGQLAFGVSYGMLTMTTAGARAEVRGDFVTGSALNHSGQLTAGVLEIHGDFTQLNSTGDPPAAWSFHASDAHRVRLAGTAPQRLQFNSPGGSSQFQTLEIATQSPISHGPSLNCVVLASNGHPLTAGTRIEHMPFTLTEDLAVQGDLRLAGASLNLNGFTLNIQGRLIHSGGQFVVGGGRVETTDDYRLQTESGGGFTLSYGQLVMTHPNDHVVVGGSMVVDSTVNHTGLLTNGVLELRGDFSQINTSGDPPGAYNFHASDSHRVVLTGGSNQHISVAFPDQSPLRTLELLSNPAAVVVFDTRAVVTQLFDHHQRTFSLASNAALTDFPDADGDGIRDPQEAFPIGDLDNNNVPDWATPLNYRYEDWAALFFWQGDPNLTTTSAPDADPDADGVPNMLEYAMATMPLRTEAPRTSSEIINAGGSRFLSLTWPRIKAAAASVGSSAVASANLNGGSWTPVGTPEILADDGQVEIVRVVDSVPVGTGAARFFAVQGRKLTGP